MTPIARAAAAYALALDGSGGGRALPELDADTWRTSTEPLFVIVDSTHPDTERWISDAIVLSDADRAAFDARIRRTWATTLLDGETVLVALPPLLRPADQQLLLGGVRLLATPLRLLAVVDRTLPTPAIDEVLDRLHVGRGARSTASLLVDISRSAGKQFAFELLRLDATVSELEVLGSSLRRDPPPDLLPGVRRDSALLRRQLARHREALQYLAAVDAAWLVEQQREAWRELAHEADELVDELDGLIDRIHEIDRRLQNRLEAALGDRLYVLTLISIIVLPLSLITSLLGVNVGGVPLHGTRAGFPIVCVLLVLLAFAQYLLARRLGWLPGQRGPAPKGKPPSDRRS